MSKDGGPAFPDIVTDFDYHHETEQRWPNTYSHGGMTLRDYFAAKAIPEAMRMAASVMNLAVPPEPRANTARIAYEIADAMLKARDLPPKERE